MTLFPIIQPQSAAAETELPLYREVSWNYEENKPIFKNGSPVMTTGKEAVLVWAWKALQTPRFRHEIYTWDYGCEAESLIGQPFSSELRQSEAARYVKECLMINPYITGASNITIGFTNGALSLSCTIITVYGEVNINV